MTAQQARDIAAAYTNPRVQPWYQELMDDIVLAAKNQETKLFIKWEGEDDGDDTNKRFLESEGYIVGDNFISWAKPAKPEQEQPQLSNQGCVDAPESVWETYILHFLKKARERGFSPAAEFRSMTPAQKRFLEEHGYKIVGEGVNTGGYGIALPYTWIAWDAEPTPYWQDAILNQIQYEKSCGRTNVCHLSLFSQKQKAFLEERGYTVSVGQTPEIGTMISWSNEPHPSAE